MRGVSIHAARWVPVVVSQLSLGPAVAWKVCPVAYAAEVLPSSSQ